MRLISWNVRHPGADHFQEQLTALGTRDADVVALQEVTVRSALLLRVGLIELGLRHVLDSFELAADPGLLIGPRQYGELIASRWPLRALPPSAFLIPWPERMLSAMIDCPCGAIELHTTHIPHGASHGWIKVETFEGIYARLACAADHPRILCGDMNTPQAELDSGEIVTWGQDMLPDGRIALEGTWRDPAGREDTSEHWDRAERNVLVGLAAFDLLDVYRGLHGYAGQEFSWFWAGRGRRVGRRFDHIFASASLRATKCSYLHHFREQGLSDHAPIEVLFAPGQE